MSRHALAGLSLVLVACSSTTETTGPEPVVEPPPTMPTGLMADTWTEIPTGGDTICSRGTDYAFFVRPGTVNKVVIDFVGGGACWNELTCGYADAIFQPDIENVRDAVAANVPRGIYDKARPENPFKDWYHVVLPYCTGDIHWGDNVATYGSGEEAITINHKGAVNTRAVLDWVYESFSKPEQVLVTGCSAGSYGSVMWAPHVAEHYPSSRVTQFGDSGAGIITQEFFHDSFPSWKAEGAFPTWITGLDPATTNVLDLTLGDLYIGLANHYPQHQFSQYNTSFDENQTLYFTVMGGSGPEEWSQKMHASIDHIHEGAPSFASFIPSGEQHCIILFDNFYTVNVDGRKLTDWLGELAGGSAVDSPACAQGCDAATP
jgi:hypothetical protein